MANQDAIIDRRSKGKWGEPKDRPDEGTGPYGGVDLSGPEEASGPYDDVDLGGTPEAAGPYDDLDLGGD
jgi:hypothetical protein